MEDMQEPQEVKASPEEQQQYAAYVKEALKPIASQSNVWQGMLKAIRAGKKMLPHTVAMLALRLFTQAEGKLGKLMDDDIIEAVAEAIIEQILIAASSADIISRDAINTDLATETYIRFAKLFVDQNPDRADDEDRAISSGKMNPGQPSPQPQQGNILGGRPQ